MEDGLNQVIQKEVARAMQHASGYVVLDDVQRALIIENCAAAARYAVGDRLRKLQSKGATLKQVLEELSGSTEFMSCQS